MTEAEWLSHGDHTRFIHALYEGGSERQLRLFACACCRRVWRYLPDERSRKAVEVAERLADGKANRVERKRAAEDARAAMELAGDANDAARVNAAAGSTYVLGRADQREAMVMNVVDDTINAVCYAVELGEGGQRDGETAAQALLAADILGNPFRSVVFDAAWQSPAVTALAKRMYDAREFGAMPSLVSALQDAGCDNADILEHCRGPLPHVRGCWVVDLILGTEWP